jgi:hypothetical protein
VRCILPGELAKHAISEGTKAVTKYTCGNRRSTRSSSAGLQFSVEQTAALASKVAGVVLSEGAAVYLSGVLEYLW